MNSCRDDTSMHKQQLSRFTIRLQLDHNIALQRDLFWGPQILYMPGDHCGYLQGMVREPDGHPHALVRLFDARIRFVTVHPNALLVYAKQSSHMILLQGPTTQANTNKYIRQSYEAKQKQQGKTGTWTATMAIFYLNASQGSAWTVTMAILNLKIWQDSIWPAAMGILNLKAWQDSDWTVTMANLYLKVWQDNIWTATILKACLDSNYGHRKFEDLAGQCLGNNYGHPNPEATTMVILNLKTWQGSFWTATMAILHLKALQGTATTAILNLKGSVWATTMVILYHTCCQRAHGSCPYA